MELKQYDVVVVGGGLTGCMAAIAAAKLGASTVLIEQYGFLGGAVTNALVGPLQTFHAGEEQIITGLPHTLIERLKAIGGSPGHVRDMIGFVYSITPVDDEKLKYVLQEMVLENHVDILFHSRVESVCLNRQDNIEYISIVSTSGQSFDVEGSVYIDCSGDGDLFALADVPYILGRKEDNLSQPMSLMFQMGGVDLEQVREYMSRNPHEFVLADNWESFEYVAVSGFFSLVEKAKKAGKFNIDRDRVLFFELPREGEIVVNMTRLTGLDALRTEKFSQAEILGKKQMVEIISFLKEYIPGFENSWLIKSGAQVGVRESRHLKGIYTLCGEDIISGRKFEDVIARGAYPIDIHSPTGSNLTTHTLKFGNSYDIPYRCLLNDKISNLLVAGRCISATHEAAASVRVTPTVMAIGQAAGTAAALSIQNNCMPSQLEVAKLQAKLIKDGCNLGQKRQGRRCNK